MPDLADKSIWFTPAKANGMTVAELSERATRLLTVNGADNTVMEAIFGKADT